MGREIIKVVIDDPTDMLGQVLNVALSELARTAPSESVEAAKRLMALGRAEVDRSVAFAFSLGLGGRTDLHPEEVTLIESLAKHPDAAVRSWMVHAADNLAATQRARAVRLLLSIDFSDSSKVAEAILGQFKGRVFRMDDLGPLERTELLKRLETCPSLDEYAIGLFLGALAVDQPEQVVKMLQNRIDHQLEVGYGNFEGVPLSWSDGGESHIALQGHSKLDRVLAQLLDWLRGVDAMESHFKTPLVKVVVGVFNDAVITVLRNWLQAHPDQKGLEVVSMCLSEAPRSIVWTQQTFVVELLQSAEAFGTDCYKTVASNLFHAAASGGRWGNPIGQEAAEDNDLATNARRIMAELPVASSARRFYRQLAEHAEQMMQWMASRNFG